MNEQLNSMESTQAQPATQPVPTPEAQKPMRAVSDPREVAALVMQRMQLVSAKKDELELAINGLVDITKQLTRTYGEQLVAVEHLRRRVKALEAAAPGSAAPGTAVQ
jgi:hypothetical protein